MNGNDILELEERGLDEDDVRVMNDLIFDQLNDN